MLSKVLKVSIISTSCLSILFWLWYYLDREGSLIQSENDFIEIPNTMTLYKRWDNVYCMANEYKNITSEIQDIKTFEWIDYSFARDQYNIYSYWAACTYWMPVDCDCWIGKIEYDRDSFSILEMGWTTVKDKNWVYVLGKKLDGIDPESYEILKYGWHSSGYWKDKNLAYFYSKRIENADIETFYATGEWKARDKNWTYDGVNFTPN